MPESVEGEGTSDEEPKGPRKIHHRTTEGWVMFVRESDYLALEEELATLRQAAEKVVEWGDDAHYCVKHNPQCGDCLLLAALSDPSGKPKEEADG